MDCYLILLKIEQPFMIRTLKGDEFEIAFMCKSINLFRILNLINFISVYDGL